MKLIKSAFVYKATVPTDATVLNNHLSEKAFVAPTAYEARSFGFVPVIDEPGSPLAAPFPGGVAFRVRVDEKIIPGSVIRTETEKEVQRVQSERGRIVGRKERGEIREGVYAHLCSIAMVRTAAIVTCFYDSASGYLIIATSSKRIADVCTSLLVHAVGSVKTETIHVSEVKHGLTKRLKAWLAQDENAGQSFGDLHPCEEAVLQDTMGRRISVKMGALTQAKNGIDDAIQQGFSVTSMGFSHDGVEFRLTHDFRLKSIAFPTDPEAAETTWESEACEQTAAVVGIINILVELLSYKEPEAATEPEAA